MSALLLRWLNDEVKVQRKVEVLERDASNGYIIAEVLHLQGLEPKFETYEKSSSTAAKIHNMELLGQKFETLGVPFPVNTQRFVMETTEKFHPKDIRFDKGIDMAVHLRKFQQAQWQTENELDEFQQKSKADTNASSAAGRSSTRAHLQEKAKFMRDWDREHHEKWKQTQRIFLATERDDLRLELTLEARRQIYAETKLAESLQDGAAGVVEFEKNMNRLGLASGGAEQSLRAIPANDAGALVHMHGLEKRVEDLDFRPSNNVKMMKELRKRRKAQLAAEKDRRMRRQKALADQKKSIETHETGTLQVNNLDDKQYPLTADDKDLSKQTTECEGFVDPREKYLEGKRPELEEHYARLRESGSAKREEDMKVLEELRLAKRKKEYLRAWNDCSDVVDGLISLAVAIVASSDRDTLDIEPMKKKFFFQVATSQSTRNEHGQELRYDLDASISNFLSSSEVWATLPLQSRLITYNIKTDVQELATKWASSTKSLDTTWRRPASFVFLSVFTEDESGTEIARRVSTEHNLEFMQLEPLLDECVKMSYDPQKLGDQVASLSDRERGLGVFGTKINSFRQKNAPVPDVVAVEIVACAVSLCRRETLAFSSEDTANVPPNGCMLHNFPRYVMP
ncbi:hypothetical protein PHMEG_0002234 [Phytophthora megakarya]|uniref:CH-like domain-containing protein n=1 Tax=Phytophthora megakarya TaxID=4795 RepID=A0A225WZX2_9STRA|nr:hypothetical protein PHMEG_0002234 [Phytophthora megakarya]